MHRPDKDGLLTPLAGRTASLATQEADIPCSSLLTRDHRKRNLNGQVFSNILASFAEFEVDLLRMRTREGMAVTRA